MGGNSSQTQNQSQNSNTNSNSLLSSLSNSSMNSGSTSNVNQNSATNPWDVSMPALTGILGQLQGNLGNTGVTGAENSAFNTLQGNANNYGATTAPQIGNYASNLLNGGGANAQAGNIQGGLDTLRSQLTPFASGSMVGNNPGLQAQLDQIRTDTTNQVNGSFAGAGRDFSGANQMALGRGIAAGQAPVIAQQYNQDVQNQLGAANSLYGAQNSTGGLLAGLNQQGLANQGQGVQASQDALSAQNTGANAALQAEAARRGIPVQALGLLAQIGIPIAGLGSTSSGTSAGANTGMQTGSQSGTNTGTNTSNTSGTMTGQTDNQMSGADQFLRIAGGLGGLGTSLFGNNTGGLLGNLGKLFK